jgi:hypothetical protein
LSSVTVRLGRHFFILTSSFWLLTSSAWLGMTEVYPVPAMAASPPKQAVDLVERFSRDRKVFLSPEFHGNAEL